MAHLIDETAGSAAVFVVGEPAWHGLGRVIDSAATSAEAIELAGLNWTVDQLPMFLADGRQVPGRVCNVRSDTKGILGVVSPGYRPVQNADAFRFMDDLVGDRLAMFHTAGALKDGKTVWMLARIPKELRAAGDDVVEPYVLLTNGHDGTRALRMIVTTVRVVCNNTLNLALGRAGNAGLTLRHSQSIGGKVEEARKKLGIVLERVDLFQEQIQALARVSMKETEVKDYFERLFPVKRLPAHLLKVAANGHANGRPNGHAFDLDAVLAATELDRSSRELVLDVQDAATKRNAGIVDAMIEHYHNPANQLPEIQGTLWAALNAVTEYTSHGMKVRGKGEQGRAENRLNSLWFGTANDVNQRAFDAALQIAAKA